jgi:excisionase family DNA binding protein
MMESSAMGRRTCHGTLSVVEFELLAGKREAMNHELMSKAVYTTSEAAQLCHLSRQAILRHVASGRLKAQRLPGSRKRRIPRESLLEFMRAQGLPTAALETARPQLAVDELAAGPSDLVVRALEQEGRLAPEGESFHTSGSILDELPSDLLLELNPAVPGAQIRLNRRHG